MLRRDDKIFHSGVFGDSHPLVRVKRLHVKLAEKLIGIAPSNMGKVYFTNSGSEANDSAVKMIWYHNTALGKPE